MACDATAAAVCIPRAAAPSVPDLSEADLADWSIKAANVKALLINSNGLLTAWNRYANWVDMARQLSPIEPVTPALDDLLERHADAMQSTLPTATEASGYYQVNREAQRARSPRGLVGTGDAFRRTEGRDVWGCRQECGWNWLGAGSGNLNIACQAARSIG